MTRQSAPGFAKAPDHRVAISAHPGLVRAIFKGREIARSVSAHLLEESGYPARIYIPGRDIDPDVLRDSEQTSYCPFKGTARYWHLVDGDGNLTGNAAWGYDDPYLECEAIAGFVAFYPDKVTISGGEE